MSDLAIPLVLMWMLSQRGGGGGGGGRALSHPPEWPTSRSPPPPMPAFVPHVPEVPGTPTPLPALHKGARRAPKPKPKPSAMAAARQAASHAVYSQAAPLSDAALRALMPSFHVTPTVSKPVAEVQALVNVRGGTLQRDGLYGPKTAAAWSALAHQHGLPAQISRGGPKIARVISHTWDVLNVPPIP